MSATVVSVDLRLRLLEKAVEMRDCGQIAWAQRLVDMANGLKKRIEAIDEEGPRQQDGLPEASTGSASGEDQSWMRLKRAVGLP